TADSARRAASLPPRRHRHARDRRAQLRRNGRRHGRLERDDHEPPLPRSSEAAEGSDRLLRRADRSRSGIRSGEAGRRRVVKAAPEKMMQLMAYADGELSGAEKKEVEALLAKDPEAKQFVAEIMSLGELVKLGHSAREIKIDITDAVMAQVKEQKPEPKSN